MSTILDAEMVIETDDAPTASDEAWREAFRQRIADVREGRVQLVTAEESRQGIRAMLDEMRPR